MDQLPLRILIVENSPARQKTLKNLFRDHAWILVNTARRALKLIEVFDFDLIALDYDLDSVAIPFSKIIRDNKTFNKLRESINKDIEIDWAYVFRRSKDTRK